jgi:hypothetical protein
MRAVSSPRLLAAGLVSIALAALIAGCGKAQPERAPEGTIPPAGAMDTSPAASSRGEETARIAGQPSGPARGHGHAV